MIRATTGGVLKSYRSNLMHSFIAQNKARTTVLTQRNFNSYAEDPAAASRAFRLHKSRMAVESQYKICNSAISKYQSAFTCLDAIDKLIDTKNGTEMSTLKGATLSWLNDPNGDAREQLTKALDQMSESLVQTMNQKYGDNFIFAGADGHNVPFEVKDNKLYYRGVPVDASEPKLLQDGGVPVTLSDGSYVLASAKTVEELPALETNGATPPVPFTAAATANGKQFYVKQGATPIAAAPPDPENYTEVNRSDGKQLWYKTTDLVDKSNYDSTMGSVLKKADGTPEVVSVDGKNYYVTNAGDATMTVSSYEKACQDADKLKYLVNEKQFVDIGLGFQENENGQLIESSGFDAALNGLTFLGYGMDEDGDPRNIYSLVQKLREIADGVPEEGLWDTPTHEEFRGLVLKLESASSEFKTQFTNHTASTTKLENNSSLLKENFYTLQEQYSDLESVDMVDAITSFLYAEYAYNAALKVGNSVLSQSLMDYLN